ncbi:Doublecortin domain-containing protein 2 [Merluccius polli]|uniref:Doublecortin domain-containing protein 2 n=1 Tax=Merluccius polli TaxID=89951 RepID=A0AA47P9J2_MERPO|nr:Doublecortin domain-containing protein 2 [Merluccius polli]
MADGTGGSTTLLPPVKSVVVYRNGDPFYCGRRFVVNQRQVATMEAFLNEVTQNIGAPLAIRSLYTPRQGHRVSHFQDLHTGGHYVAAGFERFKKLDVFRNGDLLCPPFRFIIPRSMQQDLEQILSMVTEKASLRTGAVRRLCSLDGAAVCAPDELETGQCYVAVGTERFRKLPYMLKPASGPEGRFSDSTLLDSPVVADGRRVKSSGDEATEAGAPQANQRRGIGEGRREEASVFPPRPVRINRNRDQPRVPVRNGPEQTSGLYNKKAVRRRREEVRGAQEVQDDENTHTELPLDQRVAEVVEEEEESRDADVRPHNTEKQMNGKLRTADGSPEHPRPSTPLKRDSSIQFKNEAQLYQKHPELRKSDVNNVQEAQQHNGSQADLGTEQTAAISRVSSSTSLGSRGRPVQDKNGGVEGDGSIPQSPNSPKLSLPKSPEDMEKSKTENGGHINQITT